MPEPAKLTPDQVVALRNSFLEWSSGETPAEFDHLEINLFLANFLPEGIDSELASASLSDWVSEESGT